MYLKGLVTVRRGNAHVVSECDHEMLRLLLMDEGGEDETVLYIRTVLAFIGGVQVKAPVHFLVTGKNCCTYVRTYVGTYVLPISPSYTSSTCNTSLTQVPGAVLIRVSAFQAPGVQ